MKDPNRIPTEQDEKVKADEQKHERNKELEDLREVLALAAGRRLYFRMMSRCQTFVDPFVSGMPDLTDYLQGQRGIGLWMLGELMEADADKYFQMCRENKSMVTVKEIIRKQKEEG